MENSFRILSLFVATIALAGCAYHNRSDLPPGQYEHTSSSVDSKGTTRDETQTTNVYYDENGNKKITVDKQNSTDPEGWFNKTSTKTHEQVQ